MDLLCAVGKTHGHFAFFFMYSLSLRAFGIQLCMPGCFGMLATLKRERTDPHATVPFQKDETTNHLHHDMQQSMHYSYVCSKLEANSYWLFKWPTAGVDGDTEQLFQTSGPHSMQRMCSYACAKGFQIWTSDFSRHVKGVLGQKFYFPCTKKKNKSGKL